MRVDPEAGCLRTNAAASQVVSICWGHRRALPQYLLPRKEEALYRFMLQLGQMLRSHDGTSQYSLWSTHLLSLLILFLKHCLSLSVSPPLFLSLSLPFSPSFYSLLSLSPKSSLKSFSQYINSW